MIRSIIPCGLGVRAAPCLCLAGWFLAPSFVQVHGAELKESPQLAEAFEGAGVVGTFVMLDPEEDALYVHNTDRAQQRFFPASTFKVANTLIGLETGSISSVDEILPYGGKPQPYSTWEKDMSLRDAITISNVPIYQELARRIGAKQMQAAVKKLNYGNAEIGEVVDRFWLDGPLKISPVEQVKFLHRLALKDLPASPKAMEAVREITLQEKGDDYQLHAKTGWALAPDPDIGWYVGWVEQSGQIYPFALNIDITKKEQGPKRIELTKECLARLGKLGTEKAKLD